MKIKVVLKDPDVLYDAISEAVEKELKNSGLSPEEVDAIKELRQEKYGEIAGQWFEYGEYLTVEIDTDAKTCVVVEV